MKLYVGNLPWSTTEEELQRLFSEFGAVDSVAVVLDRDTNRSRGFAFVEMEEVAAKLAISRADGTLLEGRPMHVNEARSNERGPRRGPLGPRR